jgi:O-antigen ligase
VPLPEWRIEGMMPLVVAIAALGVGPLVGWAVAEEQWSLVVLVALAGLSPIILRWPVVVAFGAYAFLVPFDSVAGIGFGGATLTRLLAAVAIGVLVATGVTQRRFAQPTLAAVCLGVFFLWAILSIAWAVSLDLARERLPTALSLFALYLVTTSYRVSDRELRGVCALVVIGGALAAGAGVLLGLAANPANAARGTLAVAGQEANPNVIAQSLLVPIGLAVGFLLKSRRAFAIVVSILGVATISAGILTTASRGSLLALAIMTGLLLYRFRIGWHMLLMVGILAALISLMPDLFFERIGLVVSGEDMTGSGRTGIWNVGLHALERFGVFGAGLSNFTAVYDMYTPTPPGMMARGAHNTFLMIWVEFGIIGLVLFLAVVVAHLALGRRQTAFAPGGTLAVSIEACCLGILVISCFGDVLWTKAFWMPWILTIWAYRLRTDAATP